MAKTLARTLLRIPSPRKHLLLGLPRLLLLPLLLLALAKQVVKEASVDVCLRTPTLRRDGREVDAAGCRERLRSRGERRRREESGGRSRRRHQDFFCDLQLR